MSATRTSVAVQVLAVTPLVMAWSVQMARWARVADAERSPWRVLQVARDWAFPPAASATAVKHQKSLVNMVFGSVLTFLTAVFSGKFRTYYGDRDARPLGPPPSLTVLAGLLIILGLATGAEPVLVTVSFAYGLVFPWGLPLRGPKMGGVGRRAILVATGGAMAGTLVALFAGISLITTVSLLVFLAPALVALGTRGEDDLVTADGPVSAGAAPNGAWIVDATLVRDPLQAQTALAEFLSRPCDGNRFVVTGGLRVDPRGTYELANVASAKGAMVVAVGRLNAVPLLEGTRRAARRVDTMKQAIRWINARLTEKDAVLYLGEHAAHLP